LGVATGGDVPEPQGLLSVFEQDMQEVFAVWRKRGARNFAVIRQVFNRDSFKGQVMSALQQRVHAEGRGERRLRCRRVKQRAQCLSPQHAGERRRCHEECKEDMPCQQNGNKK